MLVQIIASEGEKKASHALKEAADVINESANALQLRYLQTMSQIAAEKNSTIIFPLPVDFMLNPNATAGGGGGAGARGSGSEITFCKSPDGMASSGLGSAPGTLHHQQPQQQQQQQQLVINVEDLEEFTLPPPPYR